MLTWPSARQLLVRLLLAFAAVALSVLLFRALLLPALVALLHLDDAATGVLRRGGILVFAVLGYWAYVHRQVGAGMWTCVYIASRNLWVVGIHHAAWNLAIFATGIPLPGMADWRAQAPLQSLYCGPDWLIGGEFGPETSVITAVVVTASIALLVQWIRRRPVTARPATR